MDTEHVGFIFPGDAVLQSLEPLLFHRGLNVIYGLNGAGKSRLLRALEHAFQGIATETKVAFVIRIRSDGRAEPARHRDRYAELRAERIHVQAFGRSPAQAIAAAISPPLVFARRLPEERERSDERMPSALEVAQILSGVIGRRLGQGNTELTREIADDALFMFVPTGGQSSPSWAVWPIADTRLPHAAAEVARLAELEDLAYSADDDDAGAAHDALHDAVSSSPLAGPEDSQLWAHGGGWMDPQPFMAYDLDSQRSAFVQPVHVTGRIDFGIDLVDGCPDIARITREHLGVLYGGLVSALDDGATEVSASTLRGELELLSPTWRANVFQRGGRRTWSEIVAELRHRGEDFDDVKPSWESGPANVASIDATMRELIADLQDRVNRTLRSVLLDAPEAQLLTQLDTSPFVASPVDWRFGRHSLDVAMLSRAERKWAQHAIGEAILLQMAELVMGGESERALISLIDEPESALHRSAEAQMAVALRRRAHNGMIVVAATHSPELLDAPDGWVTEIKKRGGACGRSLIQTLQASERAGLESLGLLPSDLLRRHRVFLLVEGEHDEVILDAFLRDRLSSARVKVIPLHGGARLPHTLDSQVLFTHTDAHVVALLDNLRAERLSSVWQLASELATRGDVQGAKEAVVDGLPDDRNRKGDEAGYMRSWLCRALDARFESRTTPYALDEVDIIRYLPVRTFVPGADSWEALERQHERERELAMPGKEPPRDFKKWLSGKFKVAITPPMLREAAVDVALPRDFERLMKTLEAISDEAR